MVRFSYDTRGGRTIIDAQFAFRQALVVVLEDLRGDETWRDLASRLHVSESAINKLIHGGSFPSLKLLMQFEDVEPGIVERIFREYKRIGRELGVTNYRAPRTRAAHEQNDKE